MSDDVAKSFDSGAWAFTDEVVSVFDSHVEDNVPHYGVFQQIVAHLSDWLVPNGSQVVDLGAATGTTCELISRRHPERRIDFHLVDAERSMLDAAGAKLGGAGEGAHTFTYEAVDLPAEKELDHQSSDLVLALFTLQFIHPLVRPAVLRAARAQANPGSWLVVAEKLVQPSALWQEIANEATWDYKAERGVDAETIRAKARALRGVLVPLSSGEIERLLEESGWSAAVPVWRWHNWGLWAAEAR